MSNYITIILPVIYNSNNTINVENLSNDKLVCYNNNNKYIIEAHNNIKFDLLYTLECDNHFKILNNSFNININNDYLNFKNISMGTYFFYSLLQKKYIQLIKYTLFNYNYIDILSTKSHINIPKYNSRIQRIKKNTDDIAVAKTIINNINPIVAAKTVINNVNPIVAAKTVPIKSESVVKNKSSFPTKFTLSNKINNINKL